MPSLATLAKTTSVSRDSKRQPQTWGIATAGSSCHDCYTVLVLDIITHEKHPEAYHKQAPHNTRSISCEAACCRRQKHPPFGSAMWRWQHCVAWIRPILQCRSKLIRPSSFAVCRGGATNGVVKAPKPGLPECAGRLVRFRAAQGSSTESHVGHRSESKGKCIPGAASSVAYCS